MERKHVVTHNVGVAKPYLGFRLGKFLQLGKKNGEGGEDLWVSEGGMVARVVFLKPAQTAFTKVHLR